MEKEKYPEGYVDVKSISPNWVTDNFLDFMNLKLEDCKGKNIMSIGGGFGVFEMDMAKEGAKVIEVDPMFANQEGIDAKLQENIDWMEEKSRWKLEKKYGKFRAEIAQILSESKDEKEIAEAKEKLKRFDERQAEVEEYVCRRKNLLNHLKNWKENQKKYGLILNPSSGDKIEGIDKNSQDFVVIAHTLSHIYNKSDGDIVEFLKEACKLLKPDGKLYIIDYVRDIPELERLLEITETKQYYKVNKGSFVCCFDKKGLSDFLENELK